MFVATLIATGALSQGTLSEALDRLSVAGCVPAGSFWIDHGDAADCSFSNDPSAARAVLEGAFERVDVVVQPIAHRAKSLLIADMDSTMITVECIDELADYIGIKAEVAAITEAAMRGELDFEAALTQRVALLKDMDASVIDDCLEARVTFTPGAFELVQTMRARGARAILVSGGFTRFAEPVARHLGFHQAIANRLELGEGKLTGAVERPIIGAEAKVATLRATAAELGIDPLQAMAVGDGANDLLMIKAAGMGVAFHAKPIVAREADARIDHNDLAALLWAQGIPRASWITAKSA